MQPWWAEDLCHIWMITQQSQFFFFFGGGGGGGGGGGVIATAIIISLIEATVIKIAYCGWVELTVLSSFKPERWWQWRSRPGQQLTERRGEGKKWRRGGFKHYQEKGIDRDHLNWNKSCVIYNRLFWITTSCTISSGGGPRGRWAPSSVQFHLLVFSSHTGTASQHTELRAEH